MTRDNQELRDALISAAFLLKWSSADLHKKAQDLAEAGNQTEADAIREIISNYQTSEASLLSFADEVKTGQITRKSSEEPC